jgi:hypothetical protein
MIEWLRAGGAILSDGAVLSWVSSDGTAYRYAEAAAWVLGFLSKRMPAWTETRARIAQALSSSVPADGAIGRAEGDYAFDAGIALEALVSHLNVGGDLAAPTAPRRLFLFIDRVLSARRAFVPRGQAAHESEWSTAYGSHLLRLAPVLERFASRKSDRWPKEARRARELLVQLIDDLLPLFDGRRFRNVVQSDKTYVHAHCYALEGLLGVCANHDAAIDEKRRRACASALAAGAKWLSDIQRPDGAVPAWHDRRRSSGPGRADATAQAVVIWARLGCARFCGPICSAARFLGSQQSRSGGIRYDTSISHENTWTTVFAADALIHLGHPDAPCAGGPQATATWTRP